MRKEYVSERLRVLLMYYPDTDNTEWEFWEKYIGVFKFVRRATIRGRISRVVFSCDEVGREAITLRSTYHQPLEVSLEETKQGET